MLSFYRYSLGSFLLTASLFFLAPSGRGQSQPTQDAITLLAEDQTGARREVQGIVCDNLPKMREDLRDRLLIKLPNSWGSSTGIIACATNPNGTVADRHGDNNAGWATVSGGNLYYYPPNEFNLIQHPHSIVDVSNQSERKIKLVVSARSVDGRNVRADATIILRRPPVILVHGINNFGNTWRMKEGLGPLLSAYSYQWSTLEHGTQDADLTNLKTGAIEFSGNGPVEHCAEALGSEVDKTLLYLRLGPYPFSIRRVDLVAHSYGGVVCRWYMQYAAGRTPLDSASWYGLSTNLRGYDKRSGGTYHLSDDWFHSATNRGGTSVQAPTEDIPVRKLITLASVWRGLPIANYMNEYRYGAIDKARDIKGTRRLPRVSIGPLESKQVPKFLRDQLPPFKTPAYEVVAVDSPWMRFLNGLDACRGAAKTSPFLENVAYAAVAGNDCRYIGLNTVVAGANKIDLDTHVILATFGSDVFPYLSLEHFRDSAPSYSDGLIPVWSAWIPSTPQALANPIVFSPHNMVILNREALEFVVTELSDQSMSLGRDLNPLWSEPVAKGIDGISSKSWQFNAEKMAPLPESNMYYLDTANNAGRIKPEALGAPHIETSLLPNSVTLTWRLPLECTPTVEVHDLQNVGNATQIGAEAMCGISVATKSVLVRSSGQQGPGDPWVQYTATLTGLTSRTNYRITIDCEYGDPPGSFDVFSDSIDLTIP